ncbi:uncharacterized protein B0I36DRAFT_416282 [Microdochium trichocladiopsis]|uniref:Uncharacterized protein n=1 Tax=Microdochium trichocladiopsis TaxID=1682393 RepID=A0A9P9BPM9_9PEZI|nr:uncharacterized protein B0I36DRAFT_416282 [Microdochium trichocladiopsis]KAH7024716.1 hypothetical protein B0I36DRAFT_416282 [Microdochium trichocladiopsis]
MSLPPPPADLDLNESRVSEMTGALAATWALATIADARDGSVTPDESRAGTISCVLHGRDRVTETQPAKCIGPNECHFKLETSRGNANRTPSCFLPTTSTSSPAAVKRLENLVIEGEPAALPSVEQELRDAQLVSLPTQEECLTKATTLKATGNEAIEQDDYHKALKIYREALEAIYYIVTGREHYIYTDMTALFGPPIQEPRFDLNWDNKRLRLSRELLADICRVFLKLEDWNQLIVWGTQTISPMGGVIIDMAGAESIGEIYYLTALGHKALGKDDEAVRLLEVAKLYLPRDISIGAYDLE